MLIDKAGDRKNIAYLFLFACVCVVMAVVAWPADATYEPKDKYEDLWSHYQHYETAILPAKVFPYMECFRQSSRRHKVPLTLLLAVARGESDFNPHSVSSANCCGIMQIKWPITATELGFKSREELFTPRRNIDAGAHYLRKMLDLHQGNYYMALAAYNQGPGRIPQSLPVEKLPQAAVDYNGYIYHHLQYVLGSKTVVQPSAVYVSEWKLPVIKFEAKFRAEGFIQYFKNRTPAVRLEWFRDSWGNSQIVMLYKNSKELDQGVRLMKKYGFTVNPDKKYK
ncbi:MAG: hypothetical protein DRH07_11760 [Deltaproteobacteria bacterium]|nr:MAG: hypothetical protein DRH07_11760 [Deltaproteobacteria bacterium]